MFTGHAKFGDTGLRRSGLRQAATHRAEATLANDNRRGRSTAGLRRSRRPELVCHWVMTGTSRIECRWIVEEPDGDQSQIVQTAA